jgi:hypothetical protein
VNAGGSPSILRKPSHPIPPYPLPRPGSCAVFYLSCACFQTGMKSVIDVSSYVPYLHHPYLALGGLGRRGQVTVTSLR